MNNINPIIELLKLKKNIADAFSTASSYITGEIKLFASDIIPNGWMICDGRELSRTTYSKLFSIIGTKYGAGDNSTTFNIPNLQPPDTLKYIIYVKDNVIVDPGTVTTNESSAELYMLGGV